MAYYLVHARIRTDRVEELRTQLKEKAFRPLRPFGNAITKGLEGARVAGPDVAVWEEEDYCSPPLAQEREAVLDRFFRDITVERVAEGEGWRRIEPLPKLFPELEAQQDDTA